MKGAGFMLLCGLLLGCSRPPLRLSCPCEVGCDQQIINPDLLDPGANGFALLIGLDRYNMPASDSADLDSAEASVARMAAILCRQGYHVKTLTGSQVTSDNIRSAMDGILGYTSDANGDRFLLYYVGHATLRPDSTLSLILRGNGPSRPEWNSLDLEIISRKIMRSQVSQKILILDACHSGDFKLDSVRLDSFPQELLRDGGFCGITTAAGKRAFENRLSRLVAEGLEGKAAEMGKVTTGSLARYLRFQVDSVHRGDTTLSFRTKLVGNEDLVLSSERR